MAGTPRRRLLGEVGTKSMRGAGTLKATDLLPPGADRALNAAEVRRIPPGRRSIEGAVGGQPARRHNSSAALTLSQAATEGASRLRDPSTTL